MTVHDRITQRIAEPTTTNSPLYIPRKDEHDHEVQNQNSQKNAAGANHSTHDRSYARAIA